MGELIFFGVLILFSILESVARKRKQEQGEGDEGLSAPSESETSRPEERGSRSGRGARSGGRQSQESAETMLPADLWEEIAGLAAGQLPQTPPGPVGRRPGTPQGGRKRRPNIRHPHPVESRREPSRGDAVRSMEPGTARWTPSTAGAHPIHSSHRDYGTDPSERPASELDWKPPVTGNENAKRVRALLQGSGGTDALRQAVMLQEILGPPVSMKDS